MGNYLWKQKGKAVLLLLLAVVLWNVCFLVTSAEEPAEEVCGETGLQGRETSNRFVNWVGGTVYQYQFTANGVTYLHRSVPFGVYRITDVGPGSTTWTAYFYVKECVLADGKPITADNLIRYKNVNIRMAFGENTELMQVFLDGKLHTENPSFWDRKKDFTFFTMLTPWSKEEPEEYLFSGLERDRTNRRLGGDVPIRNFYSTTGIGIKTNSNKSLFHNAYQEEAAHFINDTPGSHKLLLQAVLTSDKPDGTLPIPATGCIQFQWDVYNQATLELLEEKVTETVTVPYMVE